MSPKEKPPIATVADLLLHAYTIEHDAEVRYRELAEQMDAHHNAEVAELFHRLAEIEGTHAVELSNRLKDHDIPRRAPWEFVWATAESPEAADLSDIHYLMKPYHALKVALRGEEQAYSFFAALAEKAEDSALRRLAAEFAKEEQEHIRIVGEMLGRQQKPAADWDHDADPPVTSD
jgi:rubrerythrin